MLHTHLFNMTTRAIMVQLCDRNRGGDEMTVCVPIRDLKDTSKFNELVNREHEVIVTKNGCNAFRCISESRMAALELQEYREKLRSRLILAAKETNDGLTIPYDEFRKTLQ